MLQTATVEQSTLVLLKQLQQLPLLSDCRLVGGTALALQLGHRHSVDLDFFGQVEVDAQVVVHELEEQFDVFIENQSKRVTVFKINGVKVDVVNYPFEWLEPPIEIEGVKMAGLKDIAAMKLEAVTNRGTKKDFVDVYFLLQHFTLQQMLDLYKKKFIRGSVFNVIRSLVYFEDAEKYVMPNMLTPLKWNEVKDFIKHTVTTL